MRLTPLLYTALVGTSLHAQEAGHNLADFQKMARMQPHHYPAGKIKTMIVVDGKLVLDPRAQGIARNEKNEKVSLISVS